MRSPADRAELYDWELAHVHHRGDEDVEFYARLGGPLLELACGTGRVTVALQRRGVDVVGLDIDPAMLAAAARRGAHRLVCADMRRFALACRFPVVAIPYNSLQLLVGPGEAEACLRCAAEHLAPGGQLALEVTDFQQDVRCTWIPPEPLAEADGVSLAGGLVHDLDARLTVYHRRVAVGRRAAVDHVTLRSINRQELDAMLAAAGTALEHVEEDGRRLLAVARRR